MQSKNRFFDDFSRMATGAMGSLAGMGREMEAGFRARMEDFVAGLDLVKREEFEAVKQMAANARAENEELKARIAKLEAAAGTAPAKPAPARKPAAKKAVKSAPAA